MCGIGVILAGGIGKRTGGDIPKQYQKVNEKMIIEYVIEEFKRSEFIDKIIIAAEKKYFPLLECFDCICIEGGNERNETVRNVIDYISKNENKCEKILFHDSARPMITSAYINECVKLLSEHDAVITAANITDSLGKTDDFLIDRKNYYLIQTPEAFKFPMLKKHFRGDSEWTAIVQQLPCSADVYLNYNLKKNIKITYPEDFRYFKYMLESEDKHGICQHSCGRN